MALKTISIKPNAALGTLAEAMLAAVEVNTTVTNCPASKSIPFICAMKIEATVTKRAVPSMLTVAPMGKTNLEIRVSTWLFSCIHRNVMGRAAAL